MLGRFRGWLGLLESNYIPANCCFLEVLGGLLLKCWEILEIIWLWSFCFLIAKIFIDDLRILCFTQRRRKKSASDLEYPNTPVAALMKFSESSDLPSKYSKISIVSSLCK